MKTVRDPKPAPRHFTDQPRFVGARIAAISSYFPEQRLTNDDLSAVFDWSADKIFEKTGIRERRIAAADETALDLAFKACQKLIGHHAAAAEADFVILCTQAPDHVLPTSACILQHRLGLGTHVGALDINLGCSGFVYGLSLATGLIAAGSARSVLLVTADTYSKYINPADRSVRTLFGDGAAATLIVADDVASIGPFVFGTDGSGASALIVPAGGARKALDAESLAEHMDEFGNVRSDANLYMDGSAVLNFTLREVPRVMETLCKRAHVSKDDFAFIVLHQANKFMLDTLIRKLKISADKVPFHFDMIGNTVSSTIPVVIESLMERGLLRPGDRYAMIGFGVGLSWAAATVTV